MSRYLIRLRPLEHFFFENERSFGEDNKNYIVKSNPLPQQTALLGMIRKELLVQTGTLKSDWDYTAAEKAAMDKLIGPGSFDMECLDEQNFGVILRLSPVFICDKKGGFYIKAPYDHYKGNNSYKPFERSAEPVRTSYGRAYLPKKYDPKEGISEDWMNTGTGEIISFDKLFIEDERIGIRKSRSGKAEDKGFFKQISYRLAEDFKFAFILDLSEDFKQELHENIVVLGAENSCFNMTVERIRFDFDSIVKSVSIGDKIVLLSDTYMQNEERGKYEYAISSIVDFRHMKTQYLQGSKGWGNNKYEKVSIKYTFLKRGSVLFAQDEDGLLRVLGRYKNLQKIGYNISNKQYGGAVNGK